MALSKSITQPNTTVASYWKIVKVSNDFIADAPSIMAILYGYVDASARQSAEDTPLAIVPFQCLISDIADTTVDARTAIYSLLKTSETSPLNGGTDC